MLVDASIVEAFAAGGRAAVTHRAYPATRAPPAPALFNAGERPIELVRLDAYAMRKAVGPPEDALRAIGPLAMRRARHVETPSVV